MLSALLDCRGDIERVQSSSESGPGIARASVALPDSTSARIEIAASSRDRFEFVIHQRLKPSGNVTIVEHVTWSDDPRQVGKQRLDLLKKGMGSHFD